MINLDFVQPKHGQHAGATIITCPIKFYVFVLFYQVCAFHCNPFVFFRHIVIVKQYPSHLPQVKTLPYEGLVVGNLKAVVLEYCSKTFVEPNVIPP